MPTDALPAGGTGTDPAQPKAACLDCGLPYAEFPMDLHLPRAQWLAIHPDEHGVICAACIVKRVKARIPRATVCHLIVEVAP